MRLLASHRTYAVLATLVLAAVVFLNGLGTFHTDIKPEIYIRPWNMLLHYFSSWTSSPYLGSPNFNVGLVPLLLFLSGLREIGMSAEFAFKTLHFLLLLGGAIGSARLFRFISPKSSPWAGLLAAILFVANPYTVTAGATLAIALPMAFLPWLLLCMAHSLLRPSSWAWPALVGISFFLMTGMNVAVVPIFGLLSIIPLIWALWADYGLTIRSVTISLARSAMFVVLLSFYWLVPAAMALTTGSQIVEGSETLDGIAKVSSLPEILRGLGLWPLYGSSSIGPWVPEHAVYLTSPFIIILSMLWPTVGLAGLLWANTRLRRFVVLAIAMSTVVMIGVFPNTDSPSSPLGYAFRSLLQIPALSAFRTTNKIGAVLVLALAFGAATAIAYWVPRLWQYVPARASIAVVLATVFVGWTLPAFTGGLYISPIAIPKYWEDAAASIDKSEQPGMVLVLPGQVRPNYRWTEERPDDVLNSVLDRRAILPETTPNASPAAVNFLAALDNSFQSGTSGDDVVSGMARYLGAGQVLLRHDVVWENQGGARPAQTSRQVGSDPGLFGRENFGKNGENTLSPAMEDPFFFGEQFLPPLQVYDVQGSYKPVRAVSLDRGLIVAGDGFAFPQMLSANMLGSTPLVRYAQDLKAKSFLEALEQSERLVLSDTNARRNVISNRLTAGQGPLLSPAEELGATRTLGTNANDQTVRVDEIVSVTTTQSGGVFFDLPYGAGHFAFDGDLATAWRFGDFGTAKGQSITARFDEPTVINSVDIAQLSVGPREIDKVTITAGGKTVSTNLSTSKITKVDMGGVSADSLKLTVKSLKGEGFNFVAISEINVNSLRSVPVARLPLTFQDRWGELDSAGKEIFAATPLDVLMSRVQNTSSTDDDSETRLERAFELPDNRKFKVEADIRVRGAIEPIYDQLDGFNEDVKVTSSGFYFDNPRLRASRAMDGDTDTGWIPGGGTRNSWWQLETAPRAIDGVTIVQERQPGSNLEHHSVTRVEVLVDDEVVKEAEIGIGETRIPFDAPVTGSRLRVRLIGVDGDTATSPPVFTRIDTGVQLSKTDGKVDPCIEVATIDGRSLLMKPQDDRLARRNQTGTKWLGCGVQNVQAGAHRVSQDSDFIIDRITLRDTQKVEKQVRAAPVAQVLKDGNTSKRIRVQATKAGYAVVAGQGWNKNWRANLNGKDLGPAQLLNGFSSGWIIPDGRAGVIEMEYVPQRWSWAALFVSIFTMIAAFSLLGKAVRRRQLFTAIERKEPGRTSRPAWLSTPILEGVFVIVAGLLAGLGGLAGAAVLVAGRRWKQIAPKTWVLGGVALVFASILAYIAVLVTNDLIGEVSADAIAQSMWPHYIATAGLVWVLTGTILRTREQKGTTDE